MGDQPRWPAGTPVAPSGKGPGGGRFRDAWLAEINARIEEYIRVKASYGLEADPHMVTVNREIAWYDLLERHQRQGWQGRLTRDQADRGMAEWAGNVNGYRRISELLRTRPGSGFKPTAAQRRSIQAIGHIDSIFADDASTTPVDLEVWRGVSGVGGLGLDLTEGSEFTSDAYTATSFNPRWAVDFSVDVPKEGALFRITVPAGARALAAGVGSGDSGGVAHQAAGEREVLLPRGTRFRVGRRLDDRPYVFNSRRTEQIPVYELLVVDTPDPASAPLPAPYRQIIARARPKKTGGGLVGEGRRHMPRVRDWSAQDRMSIMAVMDRVTREGHGQDAKTWFGGWNYTFLTADELEAVSAELNVDVPSLKALIRSLRFT